jgi:hypothetical protein
MVMQRVSEENLIYKKFTFQFVGHFSGLFYVSFYRQDVNALRSLLVALMMVGAVVDMIPTARCVTAGVDGDGDDQWVGKSLDQDLDR